MAEAAVTARVEEAPGGKDWVGVRGQEKGARWRSSSQAILKILDWVLRSMGNR